MRVIFNGVSALKPKTGVGHTTANLHLALCELPGDDTFWLYPGSWHSQVASRLVGQGRNLSQRAVGRASSLFEQARSLSYRLAKAAYRVHFQSAARWGSFDLYHEPNFVPIRTHLPTVITVHDLSVILHPEWHPADRVAFHERHFHGGIAAADHVIVVSESIRREVIETLNLAPDRVTAVYNGIGEAFQPQPAEVVAATRRRLNLPLRYFLAVGTIEPRKNIATILRAFCDLPASLREACPLVLAGGWGWKSDRDRELFETEARHRGTIHLGYVDDADLPALYSGATALLYPSFYEGFGLPPVEMLACGGAVIASTAAAVREVVGGHAVLLDPHDLDGWREAMRRAVSKRHCLEWMRDGGQTHASQFTWEAAAGRTVAVYRKVLGLPSAPSDLVSRRAA